MFGHAPGSTKNTQQHEEMDNYFLCTGRHRLMRRRTKGLLFTFWLCANSGERFPCASLLLAEPSQASGAASASTCPSCGHRCLASGSEVIPAQGCAWDMHLPRGEQLLLHPILRAAPHRPGQRLAAPHPPQQTAPHSSPRGPARDFFWQPQAPRRHCQTPQAGCRGSCSDARQAPQHSSGP